MARRIRFFEFSPVGLRLAFPLNFISFHRKNKIWRGAGGQALFTYASQPAVSAFT